MDEILHNQILQFSFIWRLGAQAGVNTAYFRATNPFGAPTISDAAASLTAMYYPLIDDMVSDQAHLVFTTGRRIFPNPTGTFIVAWGTSLPGEDPGETLPPQTSGLISFPTAFPFAGGNGRKYIPFPTETSNGADGKPVPGYVSALASLAAVWRFDNAFTWSASAHGITLRGGLFKPLTQTFWPFLDVNARDGWATQRRRGAFGRPDFGS